jgi:hypothetical protein
MDSRVDDAADPHIAGGVPDAPLNETNIRKERLFVDRGHSGAFCGDRDPVTLTHPGGPPSR